jgi:hypothetical protein
MKKSFNIQKQHNWKYFFAMCKSGLCVLKYQWLNNPLVDARNEVFCEWTSAWMSQPHFGQVWGWSPTLGKVGDLELSQPHFGQVWGWSLTLGKVGDLESSGTPECSELDIKGKNTSHWGVLGVIGKVLKLRYRKCPCIGNSDICSPSYGQKKGRESNW